MYRKILTGIVFILWLVSGHSQERKAIAEVDSSSVMIGDQMKLRISLQIEKQAEVMWPLLQDTIIAGIEIIEKTSVDTTAIGEGWKLYSQELTITSFDSGYHAIPPFVFPYGLIEKGEQDTLESEAFLIHVRTLDVDTTQAIKPIKDPLEVPLTFTEVLPYIIGVALLAGIVWFLFWYKRKRKRGDTIFTKKPELPPHTEALQALEELKSKKLWQRGRVKEYHSLLTDIIRHYIERRFRVKAVEMTSGEILGQMEQIPILDELKVNLQNMLQCADMVKFAKMKPLPDENDKSMEEAFIFVQKTIVYDENSDQNTDAGDKQK